MSLRKVNESHFDPFPLDIEPAHEYQHEGMDLRVYYMEDYPKSQEALEQQPTYVYAQTDAFYVLMEKSLYELTPKMYSEEVLAIQCKFFAKRANQSASRIIGGGFAVTTIVVLIANFMMEFLYAVILGMFVGAGFMFFMMMRSMRKSMTTARAELRQELIDMFGEGKLDKMLYLQEEYIKNKGYDI